MLPRVRPALAALALAACAVAVPAASAAHPAPTPPEPATLLAALSPAGGAREGGTAVLRATADGKTTVALLLRRAPRRWQAAEIRRGTCARSGAVAFPLHPALDGLGTTTVAAPLGRFRHDFVVVVHERRSRSSPVELCGAVRG